MIVLYILLGILAFLLILLLIPVQVGVGYQNDLIAWVRYGFIKIRLYPIKEKPTAKKPSGAKKQATKKSEPKKKKASTSDKLSEIAENMKRDSLSETLEEVQQLIQLVKRTTQKLLRALTIDRLYLSLIVATGEADTTAIRYGQACAAISPAATMLHETMRVKKQHVEVTPGFGINQSRVTADICMHVIPLRIAMIALAALMGFIQWTNTAQTPEKG